VPHPTRTTESTSETTTTTIVPTSANPDPLFSQVIADILEGGANWPADSDGREDYALYDTDGNGTMALLLGVENPYGFAREIFTIQNGVVERKLNVNNYQDAGDSMIYMLKTGYVCTEQANGPGGTKRCYRFENGQLKFVAGLGGYEHNNGGFRVDPTGGDRDFFFDFVPDGTEVRISNDEYMRLIDEFIGDWEPVELDWKPLAEYGR